MLAFVLSPVSRLSNDVTDVDGEALPGLHGQLKRRVLHPVEFWIRGAIHYNIKPVTIPHINSGGPFILCKLDRAAAGPAFHFNNHLLTIGPMALQIIPSPKVRRRNIKNTGVVMIDFKIFARSVWPSPLCSCYRPPELRGSGPELPMRQRSAPF